MSATQPPNPTPGPRPAHPLRRATDHGPGLHPTVGPTVSLVVPAGAAGCDVSWLLEQVPDRVDEVVVAGGPLGDRPGREADRGRLRVRETGQWDVDKGDIPHAGLLAASGDYIVLMGADGSMSPREIPHYLHYLESGYDFVKGSRFIAGGDPADYPLVRRLGHNALLRLARQLYGQRLTDLWYGFCAFRRDFLGLLDLRNDGVELGAELVAHALHYGLRVAEVPSLELPRLDGASHPRTYRDGARILRTLINERPHNVLQRLAPVAQR